VPERICSIDGCNGDATVSGTARGWCKPHYRRWRSTGSTEEQPKPPTPQCAVADCDRLVRARGWCYKHWERWRKHGDPLALGQPGASPVETPGYWGAHSRLRKKRGPANKQPCDDCGGQGYDWSYLGGDPDELASDIGPYSLNFEYYVPHCRYCHRRRDRSKR
jgi:hypothetical protein